MIIEQAVKDNKADHRAVQAQATRSRAEVQLIEDRYLRFLEDIYLMVTDGHKPMMRQRVLQYTVSMQAPIALTELGILHKEGLNRWATYRWIAPEAPDFAMAERVYDHAVQLRKAAELRQSQRRESAQIQQNKEEAMSRRNMVKLDRHHIVQDHVVTATIDKIKSTLVFLQALHTELGNRGWVNGQELGLAAMPAKYGVSKLVLITAYPDVLQHQGSGASYEVCWATDSAPTLDMAALIVSREREYVERITYSDEKLLTQLVDAGAEPMPPTEDYEAYASAADVQEAFMLATAPAEEEPSLAQFLLEEPADEAPAPAPAQEYYLSYEAPTTPQPMLDHQTTMQPQPAAAPAQEDIRMTLAKLFTKAGEYATALDLLTAITAPTTDGPA
jgi:hypothetical protein